MTTPFPMDPVLTGVAIAYKNAKLIADLVAPRVPVAAEQFTYMKMRLADGFTVPDTQVGRKSMPTEMEFGMEEADSSTRDHGLDDVVPVADIEAAARIPGFDPLATAVEHLTDLVELAREVRVANIAFAAATYPVGNKVALVGNDQWSAAATSDPIGDILTALDACLVRPNVAVLGQPVWTAFRQHPKVVKATLGNSGDSGVAARQAVAELLELDELIVGEAWVNTAKPGQAVAKARTWGKHCALLVRDKLANLQNKRPTFMVTAQHGGRVAGQMAEPKVGLKGAIRVRSGEQVRELVVADDLGYFIENAVA